MILYFFYFKIVFFDTIIVINIEYTFMKNFHLFLLTTFLFLLTTKSNEEILCKHCGSSSHNNKTNYTEIKEKINTVTTWIKTKVISIPDKTKKVTAKAVAKSIIKSETIIYTILEQLKAITYTAKEKIEKISGWAHKEVQ